MKQLSRRIDQIEAGKVQMIRNVISAVPTGANEHGKALEPMTAEQWTSLHCQLEQEETLQ
jgi:hypothetical protein